MSEERGEGRRINWLRVASIGLIVVGLGSYAVPLLVSSLTLTLPLAALEVSDGLLESASLPAKSGDLRGHNLVLVTLDTTRADRLGLYGNRGIETKTLDRLGAEGIVFTNAKSTTSSTLPTHASIFTGLYPHRHGARVNSRNPLPQTVTTLSEMLKGAGYRTAAFASAFVLDAKFGLDQGFDHYDAKTDGQRNSSSFSERSAARTTDVAIAWLERNRQNPYFLWVHYFDAHSPYRAPEAFLDAAENKYDAEIASVDHELGRLLDVVEARGGQGAPGTLVVVTADHGEAFGEHGELSHSQLIQEATIRIPLIFYATEGLARGVHVPTRVSQVDLLPTIASLLGTPLSHNVDGVDLTGELDAARAILTESVNGQALYGWAPISGIYRGRWKYVESPSPELYDLVADPLERTNQIAKRPEEAASLAALLLQQRGPDADRPPDEAMALAAEDIARLRALGYAAGGPSVGSVPANGPDPKAMLPLLGEVSEIFIGFHSRARLSMVNRAFVWALGKPLPANSDELIAALEAFELEHPDFAPVYYDLGPLYEEAGRGADAARARKKLSELIAGRVVGGE